MGKLDKRYIILDGKPVEIVGMDYAMANFVSSIAPTAPTPDGSNPLSIVNIDYLTKTLNQRFADINAMTYKGTLPGSGVLPAADAGDTYKISSDGVISGYVVHKSDLAICKFDNTPINSPGNWEVININEIGGIMGPPSAIENSIPVFADTSGDVAKDSGVTIDSLAKVTYVDSVKSDLDNTKSNLSQTNSRVSDIENRISGNLLTQSDKDKISLVNGLVESTNNLTDITDQLVEDLDSLSSTPTDISNLRSDINAINTKITGNLLTQSDKNKIKSIDTISSDLSVAKSDIDDINKKIDGNLLTPELIEKINNASSDSGASITEINNIKSDVTNINNKVSGINTSITNINNKISILKTNGTGDKYLSDDGTYKTISNVEDSIISGLGNKTLITILNEYKSDITSLKTRVSALENMSDRIDALNEKVTNLAVKVNNLDELTRRVATLETELTGVSTAVTNLESVVK